MAEVRVTFADYDTGTTVRRLVRENCETLRRMIATAVQDDRIEQAKTVAEELRVMEAALEAVRKGCTEAVLI